MRWRRNPSSGYGAAYERSVVTGTFDTPCDCYGCSPRGWYGITAPPLCNRWMRPYNAPGYETTTVPRAQPGLSDEDVERIAEKLAEKLKGGK